MSIIGSRGDGLPSPSRLLLYALIGAAGLVVIIVLFMLITPRDSPDLGGPFDGLEKRVVEVYGVESAVYTSPATNVLIVIVNGKEIRCTAPTEEELSTRLPLVCADGMIITAK